MQLTEKALKAMQLWALKDLSFGCIVCGNWEYMKFLRIDKWEVLWKVATCFTERNTVCGVLWFDSNKDFIIWHPITFWRLLYLSNNIEWKWYLMSYLNMRIIFRKYPEAIQQTIIEWQENDELMDLVLYFLTSLQEK